MAAAQLVFTLGDALWSVLEIGLHQETSPSIADVFYISYGFLFAAGIFLLPSVPLTSGARLKLALDESVVMISALLIYWAFLISPHFPADRGDVLVLALSMAYPAMDLVLLFALLDLPFRRPVSMREGTLLLLAASIIVELISDAAWGIKPTDGADLYYELVIDVGYLVSYALTGLAGIHYASTNHARHSGQLENPKLNARQFTWAQYLPYLWAGAAFLLLARNFPQSTSLSYLTWGVGCIIALIFARQILTLKENRLLYISAMNEIEERKLAEEAMCRSENMYRAIFENTGTAMFIIEDDATISLANSEGEKLVGISRMNLRGRRWSEFIEDDLGKANVPNGIRGDDQETEPRNSELIIKNITGQPRYIYETVTTIPGANRKVASLLDITKRKEADEALQSRDRILEAVSFAAEQFLESASWEDIIDEVLKRLGLAARASRIFIFDGLIDDGDVRIGLRNEWTAPGIKPYDSAIFKNFSPSKWGFTRWEEILLRGETLYGNVRDFPAIERTLLALQGVRSILVIPILAGQEPWGIMGIDDCIEERDWSVAEIESLRAAASIIGAAVQRRRAEEALLKSEERFRRLAENAPDIITRTELSPTPHLTYISPVIEKISGYTPEELYSSQIVELVHPDDRSILEFFNRKELPPDAPLIMRWLCKDGTYIWIEQRVVPILGPSGRVVAVEGFARDITERVEADARIKSSLKEKEVMLREIHHRVKNNLQVISSLLNLQSSYTRDDAALDMLRESQNRIKSMALVHERLYRSPDLARIDFSLYIQKLVHDLANSYKIGGLICLRMDIKEVFLGVDQAIPCGLIINELITNSMKHAFPDKKHGEIYISFSDGPEGRLVLVVGDNGVGLPENIDFRKMHSLGLTLVTGLVSQLDGTIEVCRERGTKFSIEFTEYHGERDAHPDS